MRNNKDALGEQACRYFSAHALDRTFGSGHPDHAHKVFSCTTNYII
jgi:hypothetical protein